jgi:hypothetical protein
MNILFDINHPAHVHFFKNLYKELDKTHNVMVTARSKEMTFNLLNKYNIPFTEISIPQKGIIGKAKEFIEHQYNIYKFIKNNNINIVLAIGASLNVHVSKIARIQSYAFTDTEHAKLQHFITNPFATKIFTPDCFLDDLGPKQIRYAGYHQSAYLLPKYFNPKKSIYDLLQINSNEKFVIMRFSALLASHDLKYKKINDAEKIALVNKIEKFAKVFITSEADLPIELQKYTKNIPYERMHDALYYAHLLICDSGAMTSEAAILGTPVIFICSNTAGTHENSISHHLVKRISNENLNYINEISKLAEILLGNKFLKEEMNINRKNLINNFIDLNLYISKIIENYDNKTLSINYLNSFSNENRIIDFNYREELFNDGHVKIFTITKEYLYHNLAHFINILADIEHEYWREYEFNVEFEGKWKYSIVMEIENIIVGYIIASKKNDRIHIHKFMIKQDYRNKKYGFLLLEVFIKNVKYHFDYISLKVYKDNIKAINFYKKNNFILEFENEELLQLKKDLNI